MVPWRLTVWVSLAMLAFTSNSLLCRLALKHTGIDPTSFTLVRLASGALMLLLVVRLKRGVVTPANSGNWWSAAALFAYAACFSLAYVSMSAATGALLLIGAVQATMIGYGVARGERLSLLQAAGFALALCGLVGLMLPGLTTPSLLGSLSMLCAGVAWGVYSLRGKLLQSRSASNPTLVTADNFMRTVPMALGLSLLMVQHLAWDSAGLTYAVVSGAIASGLGYALWYQALPALKATHAATVQLSVPVIAALGGVLFLGETLTLPMLLASAAILGGIALVILERK